MTLIHSGILPVNDKFLTAWDDNYRILLARGGRGGGKSESLADLLIEDCRIEPYFKCYYGRKVFEDVRGSCFATLVHSIKKRGLQHEFRFSEADSSSMVITHLNGNKFIPYGGDKADRLKSIKDPTHIWGEEFDQFTFDDFKEIYPALRTKRGKNRFYASFNTHSIFADHWIIKTFFPEIYVGPDKSEINIVDGEQVKNIFINYPDNYFLDREQYGKDLMMAAGGDPLLYNSLALGEWGVARTGQEFWKQFKVYKHVISPEPITPAPIHVSVDENVNPYVTVTCWQVYGKTIRQIHELPCKTPDNNAPKAAAKLAAWLKSIGHENVVFVYGDPSGNKKSTIDENSQSFFNKFMQTLTTAGYRINNRVLTAAPEVAMSGAFINEIYENNLFGYTIEVFSTCSVSINDYSVVKEDKEGNMAKLKVKDKETGVTYEPYGHMSDAKRYFIISLLADEYRAYKSRSKGNLRAVAGVFGR